MKMYFKREMERDFIKAYERTVAECGDRALLMPRREMVERMLAQEAPRFYITYEMARRNVSCILRGKPFKCDNPLRREMYYDIARLTRLYQERHKRYRDDLNGALMAVLSEYPAPRFYIGERSAYNLLCSLHRKRRRELKENRKFLCCK